MMRDSAGRCVCPWALAALLSILSLPFVLGDSTSPACRAAMQRCSGGSCPDLIIDAGRAQSSAYVTTETFSASSCAVQEGCVGIGTRKILRFDMAVANVGSADLRVGNPGSPSLSACFTWSDCHNHYHFSAFASYSLLRNGQTVAVGSKSSTCLQDAYRWGGGGGPVVSNTFTCANQGIHRGYQDVYGRHLDCQWVRHLKRRRTASLIVVPRRIVLECAASGSSCADRRDQRPCRDLHAARVCQRCACVGRVKLREQRN